jgi:hypothetical protein
VKFWLEQLRSSGSAEANQFPDEAKDVLKTMSYRRYLKV